MRLIEKASSLSDRIESLLQKDGAQVSAEVRERAQVIISELRENMAGRNDEQLRQGLEELRRIQKRHFPGARKAGVGVILGFIGLALIVSFSIRTFVMTGFTISTASMDPTLIPGEMVLVWRSAYAVTVPFTGWRLLKVRGPKRWEVVAFSTRGLPIDTKEKGEPYIKRVVGLPGEEIQIIDGEIYVDGRLATKPKALREIGYVDRGLPAFHGARKIKVPSGMYFVLGDNTYDSEDSRFWGFLPEQNIKGRAFLVFFPWSRRHSI